MYLYIENNIFINLKEIELLIDYDIFIKNKNNKKMLENKKNKIVDVSLKEKGGRTIIFTKKYIYISSYTNRALQMRSEEYENIVNSVVF